MRRTIFVALIIFMVFTHNTLSWDPALYLDHTIKLTEVITPLPNATVLYPIWQATLDKWQPRECFVNENIRVRNGWLDGVHVSMVKFNMPTNFPYTGLLRLKTPRWDLQSNPLWLEIFPLLYPVEFCPREETFGPRRNAITFAAHASPYYPVNQTPGEWTYIPLEGVENYLQWNNNGIMIVGWSGGVSTGRTFEQVELLLFQTSYSAMRYFNDQQTR